MGQNTTRTVGLTPARTGRASVTPDAMTRESVVVTCVGDQVDISTMSESWSWFKRYSKTKKGKQVLLGPDVPANSMTTSICFLLLALWDGKHEIAKGVAWQLLRWIQWVFEYSCLWENFSHDWLDHPLPVGAGGRARRIPQQVKLAIAKMGAQGDIARSGTHALRITKRFRKMNVGDSSAKHWTRDLLAQYFLESTFAMQRASSKVYSLAYDETRLSGLGLFFSALWSPSLELGCWNPPMVTTQLCAHNCVHFAHKKTSCVWTSKNIFVRA